MHNVFPSVTHTDITDDDSDLALSVLLAHQVVFINTNWHQTQWPVEARSSIRLIVNCSDAFAYSASDGEEISRSEIMDLYGLWSLNETYGALLWVVIKRRRRPTNPLIWNKMCKLGFFDPSAYADFK